MSRKSQLTNEMDGYTTYDNKKMKFLDDLFEDNPSKTQYCLLKRKTPIINPKTDQTETQDGDCSLDNKKRTPIFSVKIFIGLLFSFFFLTYVFSFDLMIVVPLSLISLFIYLARSKGNRNYNHYVKSIRKGLKSIVSKIKNKDTEASSFDKSCKDYILLK